MTLLLVAALIIESPSAWPREGSVIASEEIATSSALGTCSGRAGDVDLRRIMFLANDSLLIDAPNGPLEISIDRESIVGREIGGNSEHREYFANVDHLVNAKDDLDLELKLAHNGRDLLLYWRETFKNRLYRQGLLKIDPTQFFKASDRVLTMLCQGRGGRHWEP